MAPAVGIDLGTSNSCVGVFRHDRFEIIPNEEGSNATPSIVAFNHMGCLVGNLAKSQLAENPRNTVFSAHRLLGRKFYDPEVKQDLSHFPFNVIERQDRPTVQVEFKGVTKDFAPEEIIAMILVKMKKIAGSYLGETICDAVITCPSYFNNSQRQSIKDAGLIAGLNILQIANASAAASFAFCYDNQAGGERNSLCLDLGGGTLDVTLGTIEDGLLEVKSTAGNTHLGGEDFTSYLVDHFVNQLKHTQKVDLTNNARALCQLRAACERAKCDLSFSTEAVIEIGSLVDGIDFYASITRAQFEELCQDLFRSTIEPIERVLLDAKMDKSSVHEIILVGGSTRMPKIQELMSDFFSDKKLNDSINPDQAACYGVGILAAILSRDTSSKSITDLLLLDTLPFSLGVGTARGIMSTLIPRNTFIPCRICETVTTSYDNQTTIPIAVYQGERVLVEDNQLLGRFELTDIPPFPCGVPQIQVTFDVDVNGMLLVSAVERSTGKAIAVTDDKNGLSKEEIESMIADAEKNKSEDEPETSRVFAQKF